MLGLTDIRKGKIIVLEGQPFVVMSAEFLRKQQRRPVVRTILKHLRTNATKEHSFQQSDRVPEADVERRECQFLYKENDKFVFMDQTTYEQFEVAQDFIGDASVYLLEGQMVEIVLFEGAPVSVLLPVKIDRRVLEAPPGVRGDTSGTVLKDAVLEGDLHIKVPLFVSEGDMIKIDTRDGSYIERVQG